MGVPVLVANHVQFPSRGSVDAALGDAAQVLVAIVLLARAALGRIVCLEAHRGANAVAMASLGRIALVVAARLAHLLEPGVTAAMVLLDELLHVVLAPAVRRRQELGADVGPVQALDLGVDAGAVPL